MKTKQRRPRPTTTATGAPHPTKSAAPPKMPIGNRLLAPIAWTAKGIAWLISSEKAGGAKFVLYGMALYSFGISVETIYTSLPPSAAALEAEKGGLVALVQREGKDGEIIKQSIRYLPKPGVNDEANIAYLLPLPTIGNTLKRTLNFTLGNVIPFYPKYSISRRWTVWGDPNFYLAFCVAALVGLIEAKAIRRVSDSWNKKLDKYKALNSRSVPNLNPNAVMAANIARSELQADGMGNYAMVAALIVITYGTEFWCFIRSLRGLSLPLVTLLIYTIINVFGFEVCWAMADEPEGE